MTASLHDVTGILQKHYPYPWARDYNRVASWLAWYHGNGLLFCVTEDGHRISGIALLRPVNKPEDGVNHCYATNPDGPCIYVDFTFALSKEVRRGLVILAINRFGRKRKLVAWERRSIKDRIDPGTTSRLRTYPVTKFIRHTLEERKQVT